MIYKTIGSARLHATGPSEASAPPYQRVGRLRDPHRVTVVMQLTVIAGRLVERGRIQESGRTIRVLRLQEALLRTNAALFHAQKLLFVSCTCVLFECTVTSLSD